MSTRNESLKYRRSVEEVVAACDQPACFEDELSRKTKDTSLCTAALFRLYNSVVGHIKILLKSTLY